MDAIRLATPEEIETIKAKAELIPGSAVFAMGADLAVYRTAPELDPAFFSESSDVRRRMLFIWGLENTLRLNGVPCYYFNIAADDKEWANVCEKWGARPVSTAPEIRYKKVL